MGSFSSEKPITQFTAGNDQLEALGGLGSIRVDFGQWADECRRVDQPNRAGDVFADIFPKLVDAAGYVFGLFDFEFVVCQRFFDFFERAIEGINTVVILNNLGVVPLLPLFGSRSTSKFAELELQRAKCLSAARA